MSSILLPKITKRCAQSNDPVPAAISESGSDWIAPAINPAFAATAFPVSFTLVLILRRGAELVGYAPNLGCCLTIAAIAIIFLLTVSASPTQRRNVLVVAFSVAIAATIAAAIFRRFPDHGFDSQSYHLPSALRLLNGWRPIVEPTDLSLTNHYPSGIWTILASFDAIFGFESGRALSPLLMLASFGVLWTVLDQAQPRRTQRTLITIVLVANPVAMSQIFTSLADGVLYQTTIILICSLFMMLERRDLPTTLMAGAAMILVVNSKLVGMYFAALAVATWAGLPLLRYGFCRMLLQERRWQIASLAIAAVLAIGFVGWRPYIINRRFKSEVQQGSIDGMAE